MNSFLETSALIELVYKDAESRKKVLDVCIGSKITSRYVIFELSRGYLNNLRLVYNKACSCDGFDELFGYLNNVRRKAHFAGTITESFKCFFKSGLDRGQIDGDENTNRNQQLLLLYKGWLRKQIRYNWSKIEKEVEEIVNPTGCKGPLPAPKIGEDGLFQHELPRTCGIASQCGLKAYFLKYHAILEGSRFHLEGLSEAEKDPETVKRIKALKDLCRKKGPEFVKNDCYSSSDALIVSEAPVGSVVISKNRKHIEPLCIAFGKQGVFYS